MAGWVSLVPQAEFSLSIPLVLAQGKVRVHTRTRTWRGRSLPTPVPLAFPPITSLSVPCLWLPRQGILGEVLGGGGREAGSPHTGPFLQRHHQPAWGGCPGTLFSQPAPPPRTLASSQSECVCGGESAPPAKAQAP